VRLALEAKQVDDQHGKHAEVKGDPKPEIRMHEKLATRGRGDNWAIRHPPGGKQVI
jgi:hypothetical protein